MARYDPDYDLRDRARFLSSLLSGVAGGIYSQEEEKEEERDGVILRPAQVEHVLFDGRVAPEDILPWASTSRLTASPVDRNSPLDSIDRFDILASASLITEQALDELRRLPEWVSEGTDSSLRDTEVGPDIFPSICCC